MNVYRLQNKRARFVLTEKIEISGRISYNNEQMVTYDRENDFSVNFRRIPMGIISRFKDIMSANFNALLDKMEDPEKMIDQYLRNLEEDMAKVKAETASVMAEEKNAQRKLNECDEEVNKMGEYAKRAVMAGNDDEARQFLAKKQELSEKRDVLLQQYTIACDNAAKMRQMHDKLEADITSLKSRKELLKAKMKVAETQERMNKLGSSIEGAGDHLAAFDRMEAKVNRRLDEANAMAELNQSKVDSSIEALTAKYDKGVSSVAVDDELAALKAQMGM